MPVWLKQRSQSTLSGPFREIAVLNSRSSGKIALIALCAACFQMLSGPGRLVAQDAPALVALPVPAYVAAPPVPRVHIRRDPFARPPDPLPPREPRASAALEAGAQPDPGTADELPILPPNAGAAEIPVLPPEAGSMKATPEAGRLTLLGVVNGDRPHALIAAGGIAEIYGLGERVAGKTIQAITRDGVVLSGGARLSVGMDGL